MENKLHNFDIVIVGFGPVGQFAANLLDQYNLKVAVIEKSSHIYFKPRANNLDDEVMRRISSFNDFKKFKNKTSVPNFIEFNFPNGKNIQSNPVKKTSNGFPAINMFYQPDLESFFYKNIYYSKKINFFFDNELIDFKENNDQIALTTSSSDKKTNKILRTKFLLACDGFDSSIRSKLNIGQQDLQYNKDWLIIDVDLNEGKILDKVARQICDPDRPTTFLSTSKTKHRFEFQLLAGEDAEEMKSNKSINRLLKVWLEPNEYTIERREVYQFRAKKADLWKKGNVFLLGDAAHQIPPYAGQGLSSGIRDVANLSWKLNLVINGSIDKIMLESYQIERETQVEETIKSSIALGKLIDSLAIAYRKKIPLADAVAPEARDQAFGNYKANSSKDINSGIYFYSLNHSYAGKLIPKFKLRNRHNVEFDLDNLLFGRISIISNGDAKKELSNRTIQFYKILNSKFLNIQNYTFKNSEFKDILKSGTIIVRPDMFIYGVTDNENSLEDMSMQFFNSLCMNN